MARRARVRWGERAIGVVLATAAALSLVASPAPAQTSEGPNPFDPSQRPPARTLEEGELQRYLRVLDQLVDLGLEADRAFDAVASSPAAEQSAALAYDARMKGAIESGGFDLDSFTDVHWNTMMAYAAGEMEKHRPEIEAAQRQQAAQLEAMKSQLSPAQYEQMKQAMGAMGALPTMGAFGDVPKANVELVAKHRSELDRILRKGEDAR